MAGLSLTAPTSVGIRYSRWANQASPSGDTSTKIRSRRRTDPVNPSPSPSTVSQFGGNLYSLSLISCGAQKLTIFGLHEKKCKILAMRSLAVAEIPLFSSAISGVEANDFVAILVVILFWNILVAVSSTPDHESIVGDIVIAPLSLSESSLLASAPMCIVGGVKVVLIFISINKVKSATVMVCRKIKVIIWTYLSRHCGPDLEDLRLAS